MNSLNISTIILAAGSNNRLHYDYPKCLYPLFRKPMISYLLDSVCKVSKEVILVIKYKEALFRDFIANYEKNDYLKIAVQGQNEGTFSAVYSGFCDCNSSTISDTILIIPGDKPLINEKILRGLVTKHQNTKATLTILSTYDKDNTEYLRIKNSGCLVLESYQSLSFYEKVSLELYTSVICINKETLKEVFLNIPLNNNLSIKDIVSYVSLKGYLVDTYLTENAFLCYGINTFYDLSIIENYLRMETNKYHMKNGVCLVNPETITISNEAIIESGTIIYPNTYITGKTIIGKGSIIGPNTEIHNAVIGADNIIKHSLVYDSKIGNHCQIGPFAHLRMNNLLHDYIRIGNFVEVKASIIDDYTKASHLSYCGDAIIGKKVNIGCGTITVNYDGKNKYQTKVGDNVFIGCNSNLIAPIKIDDNALIAAGSTIYENVPKNSLSIARTYQINKEGYALKYPHINKTVEPK